MIVGATLLIVSIGTGAPARIDSSKNTNCSIAERPWPPYSSGQPIPAQPSAHICFQIARIGPPMPTRLAELGHRVGIEQLLVVLAESRAQVFLLRGVADLHGDLLSEALGDLWSTTTPRKRSK